MTPFYSKSQTVTVSRITPDGWWVENTEEHVAKGTALGSDFTENIFTPSTPGMIARYDREEDSWSPEIKDMTWQEYWNQNGQPFVIGEPDGDYPDWAIQQQPPEHNPQTETVLHTQDAGWKVYPIRIGEVYYDTWGNPLIVCDYNFELPQHHSWQAPPEADKGYVIKWMDGQWQQLTDLRGQMAFAKDRDNPELNDYLIEQPGELPDSHTLIERQDFDSWDDDTQSWQYDIERHRPFKAAKEKQWRNDELKKVLDRIDQYEKDQHYPEALRTSPIAGEQEFIRLLQDRKTLSDYPDTEGFPFSLRPELSGLSG